MHDKVCPRFARVCRNHLASVEEVRVLDYMMKCVHMLLF